MVLVSLALLIISIFVIYKSSEWVIKYSIDLSRLLGVSTLVIGFILVAISTSLPELFVTVFAAAEHDTNLAIGNILGSNLFNLNVIIGLATIMIGTIHMKRKETLHLIELLFITSVITIVIFSLPSLNALHGLVLLLLFGYTIMKLYKGGKVEQEVLKEELPILPKQKGRLNHRRKLSLAFLRFLISISLLLLATKVLVDASLDIAGILGFTSAFVGATLVAGGTSLPELAVTFAAVKKKHYALAIGDLVGSAVTNITLVLGILSIISPSPLDAASFVGMLPLMIVSIMLLWFVFSQKRKVTRFEGTILLIIYLVFMIEQLGLVTIFG